jgi:hypothetical protein
MWALPVVPVAATDTNRCETQRCSRYRHHEESRVKRLLKSERALGPASVNLLLER